MKRTIVIVECYSSAVNYIYDIRKLGYEPVLLELFVPEEKRAKERKINDLVYSFNGDEIPKVICAPKEYDKTLRIVKELNPLLILPGSDIALDWAMHLAADLSLTGNAHSLVNILRDKYDMQKALKEADLRYIPTRILHSEEEVVSVYKEFAGKKVVLKPSRASGSYNVFVCQNESEVKEAYRIIDSNVRKRKRPGEKILFQEYINGEEYVLDTVSCDGYHAALFGIKYLKRFRKGFGKIYDTDYYLSPDGEKMEDIVKYFFRVLNCFGIQYGPVHSEIIVDEKGPVLVEVNARPAGTFQKYSFQDIVMQNHETAVALDSYLLDKKSFREKYPERMGLKQPALVKQICIDKDIYVRKTKITEHLSKLESFCYAVEKGNDRIYPMTVDLNSNGGMIYLTASNEETLLRDLKYINFLESNRLDELYEIDCKRLLQG